MTREELVIKVGNAMDVHGGSKYDRARVAISIVLDEVEKRTAALVAENAKLREALNFAESILAMQASDAAKDCVKAIHAALGRNER